MGTKLGELYFTNLSAFFGCAVYWKVFCTTLTEVFKMFLMTLKVLEYRKKVCNAINNHLAMALVAKNRSKKKNDLLPLLLDE